VTTEGDAAPPAGWYQDPNGAQAWRYWDGSSWTDHVAPWAAEVVPPSPEERLVEERRWARYAKWAFVALVPFQIAGQVLGALQSDRTYHGTLFQDNAPERPNLFEPLSIGLPQVLCTLIVLGLTIVLAYWTMQAARAAQAQGVTIRRSPGWAMAGWFIPILNLWWPPQSIRSFAKDREQLRHVVGWWICFIVATVSAIVATFVAGAESFDTAIPFLVVGATSVLSFALLGVQVVDLVLAVHERALPEPS
jgi:cytochrome bd-type quinol oxidase subunit 2